jgi:hypothetical protein
MIDPVNYFKDYLEIEKFVNKLDYDTILEEYYLNKKDEKLENETL